ncbi:hypothetical protein Bca52824_080120 [Brassica carinata]|uniref:DUF4704 domain-containing protein n=1 Tax=Brassica carinata TaxID=52824 RepID=A0A8X7U2J5_BRACI|nr:hypothetical protein Bca52824_080120 [Brassica carinata]
MEEEDEEKKFSEGHLHDVADKPESRIDAFEENAQAGLVDDEDHLQAISSVDEVLKDDHFEQVSKRRTPLSLESPKPKAPMPNVSPELLHLVDSVIMGKPESLHKLKNLVNGVEKFEPGEDPETTAFLVIDSLLATMGGVESFEEDEDSNPPSVMLNSRAAIVSGELIPSLPCCGDSASFMSPRTRMVRGLLAILRSCTRNRAMCSMAGLLCVLLRSLEEILSKDGDMKWNASSLFQCIQHLAGHSLNVEDLHRWLQVLKTSLTTVWSSPLMNALEKAMNGKESRGPSCSFEFIGESSGLLGPGETRWPFTNGYAFATWIYIESFADTLNASTAAAAIAAASAAKSGNTSAANVHGGEVLVVESSNGKGSKASLHFTHAFKPQCWYFIGLEHTCNQGLLGNSESELRLYIDGSLYETLPFEFPRISKPLSSCCIGSNPPPPPPTTPRRRQCALFAEMGPVYIFKEPIGPERMIRLASRGGDVLPSFGNGAGLPWLATSDHVSDAAEESCLWTQSLEHAFTYFTTHVYLMDGFVQMLLCLELQQWSYISSPEAAKEVLKTHDHVLCYRISTDPVRATGHHERSFAWLPPFARWRFLRKITTQQLFSTRSLEATKDLRISKVQELMRFVDTCSQRKRSCEHRSRIIRQFTTLNIISNALFSTNLANFDDTEKRSASGDRWET